MWEKRIYHSGLNAFRVVKGQTEYDVDRKAASQEAIWEERWQRRQAAERARKTRERNLAQRALTSTQLNSARALALERTRELEVERSRLGKLLTQALVQDPKPSWELRKDRTAFSVPRPLEPQKKIALTEPQLEKPALVQPTFSFLDRMLPNRRDRKARAALETNRAVQRDAEADYEKAKASWLQSYQQLEAENEAAGEEYSLQVKEWNLSRERFDQERSEQHIQIDQLRAAYFVNETDALETYFEDVLMRSEYPDAFPTEHRFEYQASTKKLVLDFELPNLTALPAIKDVKYVASRQEFQESPASEAWLKKTYDDVLYQIALRTLYELFASDEANALMSVVFNGWVRSVDKSTGSETHGCIMSLDAGKDELLAINLEQVDPKACFKKMKGVSASKLTELSPVKPVVALNREDARFVEGYGVAEFIDERTNLAAMDWLDFENLIREVFEKEFSKAGGAVKITQASRDGGVDAVAFDPDPIRGGKIVIQAKRYTNTVGVSAVRDLYGTVHNEGANKGILVTTSDFGPDAYAFARDKPLTLLNGAELLYLLGQHGHVAKIDLGEARKLALEAQ